jgi:uncharacterized protein
MDTTSAPDDKVARLRALLADLPSVLVAFSGGVDSSFLLRVARDVLGARVTALTTISPTSPEDDVAGAVALAAELGVRHELVDTDELAIPGYAANPVNRCWFCKDHLYALCAERAPALGAAVVVDGVNADDLADYRPGLKAAAEHGVRHPLAEVGLSKDELRAASRALGLATWDRPASPCLSSRFPYGTAITRERLAAVGAAERALRALGFREVRVRYHGDVARLEIGADELARFADPALRGAVARAVRDAGFRYATLDLDGFRSGRLNEGVTRPASA